MFPRMSFKTKSYGIDIVKVIQTLQDGSLSRSFIYDECKVLDTSRGACSRAMECCIWK